MPTTWDPASVAAVTLSGGNLVATNTGTNSTNQGAMVAAAQGQTSGKFYFELTTTNPVGGNACMLGIGTTASTFAGIGAGIAVVGATTFVNTGLIYVNGSNSGKNVGGFTTGYVAGIAVDLDHLMIWFRNYTNIGPSGGAWNSTTPVGNDPATNTGGLAIPSGTMVPFVTFGGFTGASGNVVTANFGATAFNGSVPSGFTSGWAAAGGGGATQARAMVLA